MITLHGNCTSPTDGKAILELRGLSTDEKPTEEFADFPIANGSTFYEMNTGALFMFNADNAEWIEQE